MLKYIISNIKNKHTSKIIKKNLKNFEFIEVYKNNFYSIKKSSYKEFDKFFDLIFTKFGINAEEIVYIDYTEEGLKCAADNGINIIIGYGKNKKSKENFCDLYIKSVKKLNLPDIIKIKSKKPKNITKKIINNLKNKKNPAFFLDYDGTLTPIVKKPELAKLSKSKIKYIKKLSSQYFTAIITGRSLTDIKKFIPINTLVFAGSHGFEIQYKNKKIEILKISKFKKELNAIRKIIYTHIKPLKNIIIEEKKISIAIHYRLVKKTNDIKFIKNTIKKIKKEYPSFKLLKGKKVYEFLPNLNWNKGKAILSIMKLFGINFNSNTVIYIGDDKTDEYAFRMIKNRGVTILVSNKKTKTNAKFRVRNTEEVINFLKNFI